jgi:hypothetical protein
MKFGFKLVLRDRVIHIMKSLSGSSQGGATIGSAGVSFARVAYVVLIDVFNRNPSIQ